MGSPILGLISKFRVPFFFFLNERNKNLKIENVQILKSTQQWNLTVLYAIVLLVHSFINRNSSSIYTHKVAEQISMTAKFK